MGHNIMSFTYVLLEAVAGPRKSETGGWKYGTGGSKSWCHEKMIYLRSYVARTKSKGPY